jgi:hypothetical protein
MRVTAKQLIKDLGGEFNDILVCLREDSNYAAVLAGSVIRPNLFRIRS